MRELHTSIISTVDGFYEGPGADFRYADKFEEEEFKLHSTEHLKNYDTLMFARKTYELGQEYWTTDLATKADENPIVIDRMNNFKKVVFSTTLEDPDWGNTTLYKGDVIETAKELKQQPGEDILLIGSTSIRSGLLQAGLIDRIKIWYFPLILGAGNSIFKGFDDRIKLEVMRVSTFYNGNILVEYKVPVGQSFPELFPPVATS
ncbi:dihydrofolate reductase family protein [Streptomyces phaeochromogenes]|uniref:dihydrofolate reductase family protein n=1 Tax=Streptomyces phaeochromogenes TaxID=1923 RepID=UPI0036BCF09B